MKINFELSLESHNIKNVEEIKIYRVSSKFDFKLINSKLIQILNLIQLSHSSFLSRCFLDSRVHYVFQSTIKQTEFRDFLFVDTQLAPNA